MNTRKTKVELFLSNEEVEFIDSMRSGQMTRAAIIRQIIKDSMDESKPRSEMRDRGSRANQEGL